MANLNQPESPADPIEKLEAELARERWMSWISRSLGQQPYARMPAYLHDFERLHDPIRRQRDHRVLLNDENVGFAAANNQALRHASGTYVVLLNNDTVVPRG